MKLTDFALKHFDNDPEETKDMMDNNYLGIFKDYSAFADSQWDTDELDDFKTHDIVKDKIQQGEYIAIDTPQGFMFFEG